MTVTKDFLGRVLGLRNTIVSLSALAVLVLLLVPAVGAGPPGSVPPTPSFAGCSMIDVRQPLPGYTLPQVAVDSDGCLRHAVQQLIDWRL